MDIRIILNGKKAGLEPVRSAIFKARESGLVMTELMNSEISGDYVKRFRVPWIEWNSDVDVPTNLDGEPISTKKLRFEVLPGAIKLVLPETCPMISACL